MQMLNKKMLAMIAGVCALSLVLSGCGMFRPADDTSPLTDNSTSAADTSDTDVHTSNTEPPVPQPTETTEPPITEERVSILAVGDNIIHEAVFTDAQKRAADGAKYDFVPMYTGVAEKIAAADIAFVNHESPLAGEEYGISGYPTFNSPREAAEALVEIGFDVINLANNHIMDKRAVGARSTVEYVKTLPVTEIGVYLNEEDHQNLRITEVNGIRIAWLSFFDLTILQYTPNMDGLVIPLMDNDAQIKAEIQNAKANADFVIVSAHWGREQFQVTSEQKRMAALMSEAGADVILGHHSHIIQPVEWHENTDGSRTLITYSLGNFISTQLYGYNMVGGMMTFDIVKIDGKCTLENAVLDITVTQYSQNRDSLQVYLLEDYTEELAKEHGCTVQYSPDFSLQWIYSHVRGIVDEEFLPPCFE